MSFNNLSAFIRSLPRKTKKTVFIVGVTVFTLALLAGPQVVLFACEAGSGGGACPK